MRAPWGSTSQGNLQGRFTGRSSWVIGFRVCGSGFKGFTWRFRDIYKDVILSKATIVIT